MRQAEVAHAINQFLISKEISILTQEIDVLIHNYGYTKEDVVDEFYHTAHHWFGDDTSLDIEREIKELMERY